MITEDPWRASNSILKSIQGQGHLSYFFVENKLIEVIDAKLLYRDNKETHYIHMVHRHTFR